MSDTALAAVVGIVGLVIGFSLNVLFEHLRQPTVRILDPPQTPCQIGYEPPDSGIPIHQSYEAYRVRVENVQRRYLNSAAENCTAWMELGSKQGTYRLTWEGGLPEVTINVGDIREVDVCMRKTGSELLICPRQPSHVSKEERIIGFADQELRGKIRITCKNGMRAERTFIMKPGQVGPELVLTG